ncbi:hypothetical protein FJZ18_01115 [Candidatus Pacearchaeota archaeon]|nr:hypothetical protein [Candidatus Pacearchaeota archaeon]
MNFNWIFNRDEKVPLNNDSSERVEGFEHEYAIEFDEIADKDERDNYIVQKLRGAEGVNAPNVYGMPARHRFNGGRVHIDMKHLEGCTPEVTNTLDLLKYDRELDLFVLDLFGPAYKPRIYKMSRDARDTFGGLHRNIMTRLKPDVRDRESLLLWAVVEKVLNGTGYQNPDGQYELLQRRTYIGDALSDNSTGGKGSRPLLNLREERHCKVDGWYRFHDIAGDGNMNQVALALSQVLWKCVLQLAEEDKLPRIPYYSGKHSNEAVRDMDSICCRHSDWTLKGTPLEFRSLTSVYREFYKVIRGELYGQNTFTDKIIDVFGDTIPALDNINNDPYALAGRLDWVGKKFMIEYFMGATGRGPESNEVQSLNVDYHRIDEGGLFHLTRLNDGWIENEVSDKEARTARNTPPLTRAHARGEIAQAFSEIAMKNGLSILVDWESIALYNKSTSPVWTCNFPRPAHTYVECVSEFKSFISNCSKA